MKRVMESTFKLNGNSNQNSNSNGNSMTNGNNSKNVSEGEIIPQSGGLHPKPNQVSGLKTVEIVNRIKKPVNSKGRRFFY